MGRSAKVHKRTSKKPKSTSVASTTSPTTSQSRAESAKKRTDLKAKSAKSKSSSTSAKQKGGYVLGDADYVSLLLAGRRKAKEEAEKLPRGDD